MNCEDIIVCKMKHKFDVFATSYKADTELQPAVISSAHITVWILVRRSKIEEYFDVSLHTGKGKNI